MVIRRGDVWWFDFPESDLTHTPAKRRPVVVVQSQPYNDSLLGTVVVIGLTTSQAAARVPGNVVLPAGTAGLDRDSVAQVHSLAAVDRYLLVDYSGPVPVDLMRQIDHGLRGVLDL